MTVVYLAKIRARRLRDRIGNLYEQYEEADRNDDDRRVAVLDDRIREALSEWDEARVKEAADAAQTGRGGE